MSYPDNIDYSRDFLVWNERESVQYFSKTSEAIPTGAGFTLTDTLWTTIDRTQLESDSVLSKFDFRVQLPGLRLGTIVPKANDLMVRGNGTRWVIEKAEGPDPTDWEVFCVQDFSYQPSVDA